MSYVEERPPRPGNGVLKRAAAASAAILLLTAVGVATTVLLQIKDALDIFNKGHKPIPGIAAVLSGVDSGGPQTILLIGSDHRFRAGKHDARSDTMMLVHLDPSRAATVVLSVPRDLKVTLPERGHPVAKINQSFTDGGPVLVVKTIRHLLGIPINHVLTVNFGGFREIVDHLNCVYVDVDRRYYHSNAGLPPSEQYSEINIKPGYQRMCGQSALAYVRYRHTDTDLVRNARQQDFLRQAKEQISIGRLFDDRSELLRIFGQYTETDISSDEDVLRLLKLVVESSSHPVQEIHFQTTEDNGPAGDYLLASRQQIRSVVNQFLGAVRAPTRPQAHVGGGGGGGGPHRGHHHNGFQYVGVFPAAGPARQQAAELQRQVRFPVYYPTMAANGSSYVSGMNTPRAYRIFDREGRAHQAYRMVVQADGFGQYYGIQGLTWRSAPILDDPDQTVRLRGRNYQLYFDGHRLRLVAWTTPQAVYWVSNSLSETLSPKQMLGIARSLVRYTR